MTFEGVEAIILDFANSAHRGQKRKYTGEDYIEHPIAVALAVREQFPDDSSMVCAALLHDVLEDTDVDHAQLRAFLHRTCNGLAAERILKLVVELTDVYTNEDFEYLNRAERKRREAERLRSVSYEAQCIKRADISDNSLSINEHDPKFAEVFNSEKAFLLSLMQ
jgi:(p)ppGpp synthase/HD superfamily hydrolase